MIRVLFVCLGNICRSPAAQGVFMHRARRLDLDGIVAADSAAVGPWHVGQPPDTRTQDAARRRGVDLSALRARRLRREDGDEFDYIVAMDRQILRDLKEFLPGTDENQAHLFLDFAGRVKGRDVPDPYYGTAADFERMMDLIEEGVAGLLTRIAAGRRAP